MGEGDEGLEVRHIGEDFSRLNMLREEDRTKAIRAGDNPFGNQNLLYLEVVYD